MNKEIASLFSNFAIYLEIDSVAFKPQAYVRAAGVLGTLDEDVRHVYKKRGKKGLVALPAIGNAMAEQIEEHILTGKIKDYEVLKKKIPVDIEELTRIEGVGPKMVRDLYNKLNIKTLSDLEKAAQEQRIRELPGFGEKTEQNILQGITFVKQSQGRRSLGDMYPVAQDLVKKMEESGVVQTAVIAGSMRRMKETIGDIDILVGARDPKQAINYFLANFEHEKIWGKGITKVSVHTKEGFDIDMRIIPKESFGAGLQYFTGSKAHNVKLRAYAAKMGYKLNEYGFYKGKKLIAMAQEQDVYKTLGMAYIEPELREDTGEIEAALAGKLPNSINYDSLKGDLQVQTDWTDGKDSIETMAKYAKKQGLAYIAITDHTKDLAMTGGLDEKKLQRQALEIDKLNKKISGITILKGAEVNIRKDGSLDITDEALAKLDVVGVSVHSNFKMTRKDMTQRIRRAMQNAYVDILFHPTGRLINKREAYEVDIDNILLEAKETGTVIEINAFPERLDLKDSHIKKAVDAGCMFAINSDAHTTKHMEYLRYGIGQARRGWVEAKDVVNTYALGEMRQLLKDKRNKK